MTRGAPLDASLEGGLDWAGYMDAFVADRGGWAALVDELARRARGSVSLPVDPQSLEKGLRRLAARGHAPGGKYGRLMLRFFGVPADTSRWARWLGQYHSRFADMPARLRLEQLLLWDRPPTSESSDAVWINQALASVRLRLGERSAAARRLALARAGLERATPAARVEVLLLEAYLASGEGDRARAGALLDEAEPRLSEISSEGDERECYRARLSDQRAYLLTRTGPGEAPRWAAARALYDRIDPRSEHPFVGFRRAAGVGRCAFELGEVEEGRRLARRAIEHAGDGGYVRFRVMALSLLAKMVDREEAEALRARARRLALRMDDADLASRVARH